MSVFLEILKCILCCEDEYVDVIDYRTSFGDSSSSLSSSLIDSARNESRWQWRRNQVPVENRVALGSDTNRPTSIGSLYFKSSERVYQGSQNSRSYGTYDFYSSPASTKPPQSPAKPSLCPSSPSSSSFKPATSSPKPPPSSKPSPSVTTPAACTLKPSSSSPKPPAPSPKPPPSSKPSPSFTTPAACTLKPSSSSPKPPTPTPSPKPPPSSNPSPSFTTPAACTLKPSSSSPKSPTPSKPSIQSPKLSSSSSKPSSPFSTPTSSSLKLTLSPVPSNFTDQKGKGKYKWAYPKDNLPIYMIPKDIEDLIKSDIVPEVLKKPLSPSTYQDYFAALLYAEDYYVEKWGDFELKNVSLELHPVSIYQKSGGNTYSKASNKIDDKTFVVFKFDSLSKNRPFLLSRDFVFAQRSGKQVEPFQGVIYRVQKSMTVLVEFGDEFHSQHDSTCRYNVSFSFNRVCLKRAHQAIAAASAPLFRKFLFPDSVSEDLMRISASFNLYNRDLNRDEKSAVHRILNVRGPPPFLVNGPLCATCNGNSESFSKQLSRAGLVVKEAVLQIYHRLPRSKILVCAPINSTCDVLTRSLKMEIPEANMFRANAAFREVEEVPIDILPSCLYERETDCFSCPSLQELRDFRVIFSTFTSSYRLYNAGIPAGHFSHIFLVDASSATEPEMMVAVANFADESTTIVVTGAPGNRSSVVRSDIARQKGLKISYFERLRELGPYKNGNSMFIAQLKDRV